MFDNILLLEKGQTIYFGPIRGAVPYFTIMGLTIPPRRTIPDFLATVIGRANELIESGQVGTDSHIPSTVEEFQQVFQQSREHNDLIKTIKEMLGIETLRQKTSWYCIIFV